MTGKRFTMIYFETDGNLIFDETKHDGEWYNSAECLQDNEIVGLLNELDSRNKRLEEKIQRERISFTKTHARWSKESEDKIKELSEENNSLKNRLDSVLKELYCKDRRLEELGESIDCCDEK